MELLIFQLTVQRIVSLTTTTEDDYDYYVLQRFIPPEGFPPTYSVRTPSQPLHFSLCPPETLPGADPCPMRRSALRRTPFAVHNYVSASQKNPHPSSLPSIDTIPTSSHLDLTPAPSRILHFRSQSTALVVRYTLPTSTKVTRWVYREFWPCVSCPRVVALLSCFAPAAST